MNCPTAWTQFCTQRRGVLDCETMIMGERRRQAATLQEVAAPSLGKKLKLGGKKVTLLQRVHEARDRAVQVFV